jgi:hypothetical protein
MNFCGPQPFLQAGEIDNTLMTLRVEQRKARKDGLHMILSVTAE